MEEVYVFQSPVKGKFCSGIFSKKELAEEWIKKYSLTGVLTLYPVNESVYDWAIRNGNFSPKKQEETTPDFIAGFSSASQIHFHYEDGILQ